jgi:hypothetical protein
MRIIGSLEQPASSIFENAFVRLFFAQKLDLDRLAAVNSRC